MHPIIAFAASLLPLTATGASSAPETYKDEHLQAALISAQTALVPGSTAMIGLHLAHAPHWHTYWINPGDSGLATKLAWTLPPGYRAGDIQWPTPQRLTQGRIYDFGYTGNTLLPVALQVPEDARPGTIAHLQVEARWLVCREQCIPGKTKLKLDLPIGPSAAHGRRAAPLFRRTRAAQPKTAAWQGRATLYGDQVDVSLIAAGIPADARLDAFAQTEQVVANAPPRITRSGRRIDLRFAKNEYYVSAPPRLTLLLVAMHGKRRHAYRIDVPFVVADKTQPSS